MSDAVFAAVAALIGSIVGTLGGILTSAKLTDFRLSQLEKKMDELSKVVSRIYQLEQRAAVHEERLRSRVTGREVQYPN